MDLTVAELFAGVGGFRVGLNHINSCDINNRAIECGDWDFVWANQYEPSTKIQHAFNCYITRFGDKNHSNIDINKVNKAKIPNHSLLVGGFPCQDYSVARLLSNEKGIEGKKGVLFWDIRDIIIEKKSPFVLLENVDRLLKSPASKRGRDFAVMLRTFEDLGYDVQWRVINAGEYSMPQKRRRVFIFAYKHKSKFALKINSGDMNLYEDNIFNNAFPVLSINDIASINLNSYSDVIDISNNYNCGKFLECGIMSNGKIIHGNVTPIEEKKYTLADILEEAMPYNENIEKYIIQNNKLNKWRYLKDSKKIERTSNTGHTYTYSEGRMAFPDNLKEPARTMLTSEGTTNRSSHIIFDEVIQKYRILTPVECELIQMFPPNWTNTMPNRKRYFMMGNALVTGIVSRIEPIIRAIIEQE